MYNPKSHKAEEFINHEEVLASINYAEENKNNLELIDKILEKGLNTAKPQFFLRAELKRKTKRFLRLPRKLKKIITATGLYFLHLFIFLIIV